MHLKIKKKLESIQSEQPTVKKKKQLKTQASTTFTNRLNIETSQTCLRCCRILFPWVGISRG